jgi:hypothetical protein
MLRLPAPHFRSGGSYGGGYSDRLSRSQIMREARRIARAHHLTLVSDWPMPLINLNCVVMRLPPGASAEGVAAEVSRDRLVQWSQPMHDYQTLGREAGHDDPLYPAQPARPLWRLDAVHRIATGRGVTVAIPILPGRSAPTSILLRAARSPPNATAPKLLALSPQRRAMGSASPGSPQAPVWPGCALAGKRMSGTPPPSAIA